MRSDLLVVGAGLFGSVIGRYAQRLGLKVRWVDSADPRSASKASAGLFKPEWLTAMSKERMGQAMLVLQSLAQLDHVELETPVKKLVLQCIPPSRLLVKDPKLVTHGVANLVASSDTGGQVHLLGGEVLEAKYVVVAAGVGVNDIVGTKVNVTAKAGVAFTWKRTPKDVNRFDVWAPYKQTMVFERDPGVMWGGDGTALKPESLTEQRAGESALRVGKLAQWNKLGVVPQRMVGYRPFVEGHKGGLLLQVQPNVWVATGGGKIGTVAAGAFAREWAQEAGVL